MSAYLDFHALFSAATDREIIPANDNGEKPAKPFITLRVDTANPQPIHKGRVDDDGIRLLSSHRGASIRLQVYGVGSWEIAERLALSLSKESIQALAEELNLSINERVRIQDVPALMDNATYESRAILDIDASYTASVDDDVGFIETVHGEIDTEPGTVPPQSFIATVVITP